MATTWKPVSEPLHATPLHRAVRDPCTEIDAKIVPLFDRAVDAMATPDEAGHRYLANADGEDPDALAAIGKSLEIQAKQRASFAEARELYREESRLLHAGPLSEADQRRIGTRMVQLFSGARADR